MAGESDAINGSQSFVQDFEAVITRFRGEPWFPYNTPITIMGVSVLMSFDAKVKFFNHTLRQVASREPENRIYVNTSAFPASYWITPELIHMTAEGLACVVKRYIESRANAATLADDAELGFINAVPSDSFAITRRRRINLLGCGE